MKTFTILLLTLLLLPSIFALEISMDSSYDQAETMIIKISGIIDSQVPPENVYFYKGNTRVPVLYDIAKLNSDYYIYAIAPEKSGNYSLRIKGVAYRSGTKVLTSDIEKNFSVSTEIVSYNINPGYIITQDSFYIKLQSFNPLSLNININSPFDSEKSIFISPGEERTLQFSTLPGLQAGIYNVSFSSNEESYSMPVLLTKSSTEVIEKRSFHFSDHSLVLPPLTQGLNQTYVTYIYNTGQKNMTNISLYTEGFNNLLVLDTTIIENLPLGSNQKIKLFIYPSQTGTYNGKIIAKSEDLQDTLYLTIKVSSISAQLNETEKDIQNYYAEDRTCRSINGRFCDPEQKCICDVNVIKGGKCDEKFLEGVCCLGSCQVVEEENNSGSSGKSTLGWFIVLVLLVGLFWFLKRNMSKS